MKNITISVEDELYYAAKVAAAQKRTNVTAVLRVYLTAFAKGKAPLMTDSETEDADKKNREELVMALKECNLVLGYKPSRDKTYAR